MFDDEALQAEHCRHIVWTSSRAFRVDVRWSFNTNFCAYSVKLLTSVCCLFISARLNLNRFPPTFFLSPYLLHPIHILYSPAPLLTTYMSALQGEAVRFPMVSEAARRLVRDARRRGGGCQVSTRRRRHLFVQFRPFYSYCIILFVSTTQWHP